MRPGEVSLIGLPPVYDCPLVAAVVVIGEDAKVKNRSSSPSCRRDLGPDGPPRCGRGNGY
jgi:hypothetical protein